VTYGCFISNTAIRGGTVGAALAVVGHGGSQWLYQKTVQRSLCLAVAMSAVNGLLSIDVFGFKSRYLATLPYCYCVAWG
jgi:hypothetical protein